MTSGDGVTRRGHLIAANFIGDYPEQLLVTGIKTGECYSCKIEHDNLGSHTEYKLRDLDTILNALDLLDGNNPTAFTCTCKDAGIKPIQHPFWKDLPYLNIYYAIIPDILHQLYQGVVKHLFSWLKASFGADEIDARCCRLPPNHNIRLFMKGITSLLR